MTSHYLDYRIDLPAYESGEISHVLSRLWQRVHGVLASQKMNSVGLSLPEMQKRHPGSMLRLHGAEDALTLFSSNTGMQQLLALGMVVQLPIQPIPEHYGHCCFLRVRDVEQRTPAWLFRSEQRWLKRAADRGETISAAQILERREALSAQIEKKEKVREKKGDVIYLRLYSRTTHRQFSLVVQKQVKAEVRLGGYTYYGLSHKGSTVPWF